VSGTKHTPGPWEANHFMVVSPTNAGRMSGTFGGRGEDDDGRSVSGFVESALAKALPAPDASIQIIMAGTISVNRSISEDADPRVGCPKELEFLRSIGGTLGKVVRAERGWVEYEFEINSAGFERLDAQWGRFIWSLSNKAESVAN
jgi:hypothetical protein